MSESKCASCAMGSDRIKTDGTAKVSGFCSESCDCDCHDAPVSLEREVWHDHNDALRHKPEGAA